MKEAFDKDLVSINIVNWNGMRYLKQCLESIKKQTYPNIEIIIVDNNSNDGSLEFLKSDYPEINIVENKINIGFSRAHNQAIQLSKGEFIIPLNFDIFLFPDFVKEMVKAVNSYEDVGIVSGKLYKKFNNESPSVLDTTGITMNNMFSGDRGENSEDYGQFGKSEFVFGASGAAPLYKRKMLEDIKIGNEYFDEDFFIYVEDVDLCWRAQLYGWKCIYTPYAIALHERGATRREDKDIKKGYYMIGYRNRYLTIFKNSILSNIIGNIGRIVLRETYFYLCQINSRNFYVLKVPFSSLLLLPKMMKKRREIQKKRRVSGEYMEKFFFGSGHQKKEAESCK